MKLPESLKKYLLKKFLFAHYPGEHISQHVIDFGEAVDDLDRIVFNGILVDRKYQIVLPIIPSTSTHEAVALLLGKTRCKGIPDDEDEWYSFNIEIFEYISGNRGNDRRNNDYSR